MTASLQQAVLGTLDWLMEASRDGIRPEAARRSLSALERRAETEVELLWEEDPYDGFVHYDALLHLPEGGTVSLSFCPPRALPWPLRGAHRWSDADLVRVNQRVLRVDEAIGCLDFIWDEAPLVRRLIDMCLIQETLEREPIELSGGELQEAMDAFRRARRLYTAAETRDWMERHGITHPNLERLVANHARVAGLRERVTAGRVEGAFAARRAEFDTARFARLDLADEDGARHLAARVRRGELGFYEAAEQRFLEDTAGSAAPRPVFESLRRSQMPPALADAIFGARAGDVVGPVRVDERFVLVRVLSLTPASLDEPTQDAIRKILFADWLAERRRTATIEWCWGNAQQTSRLGS